MTISREQIEQIRARSVPMISASELRDLCDMSVLLDEYYAAYPFGRLGERYRFLRGMRSGPELINAAPHAEKEEG